jgi:hypothetical protein
VFTSDKGLGVTGEAREIFAGEVFLELVEDL